MGAALEIISATATAAAAAGTDMTAAAGDTLQVRSPVPNKPIKLLGAWADVQTAGFFRIRSPRLHDNTQGLRFQTIVGDPKPMLPLMGPGTPLFENDTLVLTVSGAAVVGDIESASMLIYYSDLDGVSSRLIDVDTLMKRAVELVTVENTITTGAGGGYTGAEALNAEFDLLKANNDYALIGYRVRTECATVTWRGSDTGNFRVGGPGDENGADYTSGWFMLLSKAYGLPLIPVFNSNNRGAITLEAVQDENAAAVQVSSIFARLG